MLQSSDNTPENTPASARSSRSDKNLLRLTLVDARGAASFVGHGEALPALMRACTTNPHTVHELLERADPYFVGIRGRVENGLAVFDELNVPGNYASIRAALRAMPGADTPVFRIVDDATREASLRPVRAGCVVFNLMAHRIITLQYRDGAITRNGSGQVFDGERVTGATFSYRLPQSWALVP